MWCTVVYLIALLCTWFSSLISSPADRCLSYCVVMYLIFVINFSHHQSQPSCSLDWTQRGTPRSWNGQSTMKDWTPTNTRSVLHMLQSSHVTRSVHMLQGLSTCYKVYKIMKWAANDERLDINKYNVGPHVTRSTCYKIGPCVTTLRYIRHIAYCILFIAMFAVFCF